MLLKSLEIKNYRSLEHVKLDKLQEFNVLIGRNNAGKSSVFQALYDFIRIFQGNNFSIDVLTDRDRSRQIEINLAFTPRSQEREVFVDELIACGFNSYRKKDVLESPFFSEIQFFFKSPESNPTIIHLRETRIIAEDGQWAVIQQLAGNDQQTSVLQSRCVLPPCTWQAHRAPLAHRFTELSPTGWSHPVIGIGYAGKSLKLTSLQ